MSTTLAQAPRKASALSVMAERFSVEPQKLLSTLKSTVFKGASEDELLALVVVANEYRLNPLTREIYAFPAKGGGITPIISIDGWANLANSHPQFDGLDFEWHHEDGKLIACTCIIFRKDRGRPVKVTEYLSECRRNTEPWKMEHRMLRHKALSQCVRVAFGYGGVYDEDEARDIQGRVIEAEPQIEKPNWMKIKEAQQNQSPTPANGAQGEPAPAFVGSGAHETKPESEANSGWVTPEDTLTEYSGPYLDLKKIMDANGINTEKVETVCREFKLLKGSTTLKTLNDLPEKAVNAILSDVETFLDAVKGGNA